MNINGMSGFGAGYSVKGSGDALSGDGRPAFGRQTYNSLGDMTAAMFRYEDQWTAKYSAEFAESGSMTTEELLEYMREEFAGYGVRFVDHNPKKVTDGQHLVYIDEVNLNKMAADPEYRAKTMGLMQREFAGIQGYSFRDSQGVVQSRLSGTVFSLSEENPLVGGSRYAGMCQSPPQISSGQQSGQQSSTSGNRGKSVVEAIAERLAELRDRMQTEREEAKQAEDRRLAKTEENRRLDDTHLNVLIDELRDSPASPPLASDPDRGSVLDLTA